MAATIFNRSVLSVFVLVAICILIPSKNLSDAAVVAQPEEDSNDEYVLANEDRQAGEDQPANPCRENNLSEEENDLEKLERSLRARSDFLIRPTRAENRGNGLWSHDFLARPTRQQQDKQMKGSKGGLSSFFSRPSRSNNNRFLIRPTRQQGSNKPEPINVRSTSWGGFLSRPTRQYVSQPEPKEITLRSTSWGGFLTRPTKREMYFY